MAAVTFTYAQPALDKTFLAGTGPEITFADLIGMPYWVAALVFAGLLVAILIGLERWRPWQGELGRDIDGDFGEPTSSAQPRARVAPAE